MGFTCLLEMILQKFDCLKPPIITLVINILVGFKQSNFLF